MVDSVNLPSGWDLLRAIEGDDQQAAFDILDQCPGLSSHQHSKYFLEPVYWQGITPLMAAARRGHYALVRRLLGMGAPVDLGADSCVAGYCGRNVLWFVPMNDASLQIGSLLLQSGVDPTNLDLRTNGSVLMRAVDAKSTKWVQLLLPYLPLDALNHQNKMQQTALLNAARLGLCDIVSLLLEAGADPCISGLSEEVTPLAMARFYGHKEVVAMLELTIPKMDFAMHLQ